MAGLPRIPVSSEGIFPADIANAIMGLRFDTITSIKWDIRPSVGLVAKDIERLGLDIRSFKEPMSVAVKTVIIPSIRKNFDSGGRPAWEPLAEGTIKHRGGAAWPILQVTGKLRKRATQFSIWDIGPTTATIRSLPADVFYGAFHQAGAEGGGGGNLQAELKKYRAGSPRALNVLKPYLAAAQKELGANAPSGRIYNRAVGLLIEADQSWSLPARPFIMWQDSDIPKIEAIFSAWMQERATRVGRFHSV